MDDNSPRRHQVAGLILGPALFVLILLLPQGNLSAEGQKVAAVALWMVIWWITEAVPIPVTALLPMALLPITGVFTMAQTTAGYSNRLIYVFFGGFIIALAIQRWNLHRRIALSMIHLLGTSMRRIALGFILTTGLISMWISNTATTMMILPIAMAVIGELLPLLQKEMNSDKAQKEMKRLSIALMLGIAYSASVGGMGTLIGTPPNAVFAGVLSELAGREVTFLQWIVVGMPLALVGIFLLWLYISFRFKLSSNVIPGAQALIQNERNKLGPMSNPEKSVLTIFILVALAWLTRRWFINPFLPKVDDAVIGMTGALLLFVIPSSVNKLKFVLDWKTASKLPWGIILLFGSGFTLASAFQRSGLSEWLGNILGAIAGIPLVFIIVIVVTLVTFMTEVTSNTASTTLLMPIMYALAMALGVEPTLLMASTALAASCAFMLPVATPPNAIVFGSGYLTIPDMVKTGFKINMAFIVLISGTMLLWNGRLPF